MLRWKFYFTSVSLNIPKSSRPVDPASMKSLPMSINYKPSRISFCELRIAREFNLFWFVAFHSHVFNLRAIEKDRSGVRVVNDVALFPRTIRTLRAVYRQNNYTLNADFPWKCSRETRCEVSWYRKFLKIIFASAIEVAIKAWIFYFLSLNHQNGDHGTSVPFRQAIIS